MKAFTIVATALLCGLSEVALAGQTTTITFDNGLEGWTPSGPTQILPTGGNPDAHARTTAIDTFGLTWRTNTNQAFLGDLTQYASITISIDVKVESITFFGSEVSRDLVAEFRSYELGQNGFPYSSVWFNLGTIQAGQGWQTLSVTFDPSSTALPAGWGGYGAEDPNTFEPILPPNLTFADVMADVEELAFTTFVPGFFYGFTNFDVRVDNISITVTPIPSAGALPAMLAGLGLLGRRRRRA